MQLFLLQKLVHPGYNITKTFAAGMSLGYFETKLMWTLKKKQKNTDIILYSNFYQMAVKLETDSNQLQSY